MLLALATPPPQGNAMLGLFILSLVACPAVALLTWLHPYAGRALLGLWMLAGILAYGHAGGSLPLFLAGLAISAAGYWLVRKRVQHPALSRVSFDFSVRRKSEPVPKVQPSAQVPPREEQPASTLAASVECQHCGARVPAGFPHCPGCGRTR
ncbi:MAG TPA: hypothetical protein VFE05_20680 [Longimicrobiaceae bacterium]|jgi:hypothetical protein|nr:hypothetical protein [Longimicrobiaceae bacterium]